MTVYKRGTVWMFGRGAHVYVCGDGMRMAKDVHAALAEALVEGSRAWAPDECARVADAGAAEALLAKMGKDGRYCKDVWG